MAWDSDDLVTESIQLDTGHQFDGIWIDPWYWIESRYTITFDTSDKVLGNGSIKSVNYKAGWDKAGMRFEFEASQNMSGYTQMEFWIKVPDYDKVEPTCNFALQTTALPSNNWSAVWYIGSEIQSSNGEWVKIVLDLTSPDFTLGLYSSSSIASIELAIAFTEDILETCFIDGIKFSKEVLWTGAGSDELWSNADNWSDISPPSEVEDLATFRGSASQKNCIIQSSDDVPGAFTIESDYTGTIYTPDVTDYWGNAGMFTILSGGTIQASGSSLGIGVGTLVMGSVILNAGLTLLGPSVDMGVASAEDIYFARDGTLAANSDLNSSGILSLGTGGVSTILEMNDYELSADYEILTGQGVVDFDLPITAGEDITVNVLGNNPSIFGNEENGTSVLVGASGGAVWNYTDGGSEIKLAHETASNVVKFFGPSEGGAVTASGATLRVYDGGEFYSYGGDVILGDMSIGTNGVVDIDGGELTVYGDIYSEGSVLADVDATNIFATSDVLIAGASLWNLNVDSGGNNITVTVSGCTLYGKVDVADGDDVVLAGGTTWEQAQVKWNKTINNKWKQAENWQLGHIPEEDDIAWFDGSSVIACNIKDAPVVVPKEILIGPDHVGPNAKINNQAGAGWGGSQLKITALGTLGDSLFFNNTATEMSCGELYAERGQFGLGNSSGLSVYGDLYFAGDHADRFISKGTDDRTWIFDTRDPDDGGSPYYGYNSVWAMNFEHTDGLLTIEGELHNQYYFNVSQLLNDNEDTRVHVDADIYLYRDILDTVPWNIYSNIYFTIAPDRKIQHLNEETADRSAGFFSTGDVAGPRKFEFGASGSGLWNFESYWEGETLYGGYYHLLTWGHVIGLMPRWHHKPHEPYYAKLFGMAPGYSWVSHNCGLHVASSGQFINYGGDIQVEWFEITEKGYFDQADGNLIITGKASPFEDDRFLPAPGEPYIDHNWAIWSTGTWVWTPGASVIINTQSDCDLWGATLPNLVIDSGGNNITVTASGCTFAGQPTIADGDRLVIISEDPVVEEIIPELGISRKVGDYLVTELTVKMERD